MTAGTVGCETAAPHGDDEPPRRAFDELAVEHQRPLRRMLRARGVPACDVDDIVQETLLWAWRQRGRWTDVVHVRAAAWMYAWHRHVDRLRSADSRLVELRSEFTDDALGVTPDAADMVGDVVWRRDVLVALQQLPFADRMLLAALIDGDSYEELAARWGSTPGALRVRAHRARARFRVVYRPGALTAAVLALPRAMRRVMANVLNPVTLTARVAMTSAVLTIAAPLVTAPVVVTPDDNPTTLTAVDDVLRRRVDPAQTDATTRLRRPPQPTFGVDATTADGKGPSRPPSDTCVADRLVCVGEPPPSGSPSPSVPPREGDWVCASAAGQCVSQQVVGVCPYVDPLPDEVATCTRYSDPRVDPPPPPDPSPSASPSPTPTGTSAPSP